MPLSNSSGRRGNGAKAMSLSIRAALACFAVVIFVFSCCFYPNLNSATEDHAKDAHHTEAENRLKHTESQITSSKSELGGLKTELGALKIAINQTKAYKEGLTTQVDDALATIQKATTDKEEADRYVTEVKGRADNNATEVKRQADRYVIEVKGQADRAKSEALRVARPLADAQAKKEAESITKKATEDATETRTKATEDATGIKTKATQDAADKIKEATQDAADKIKEANEEVQRIKLQTEGAKKHHTKLEGDINATKSELATKKAELAGQRATFLVNSALDALRAGPVLSQCLAIFDGVATTAGMSKETATARADDVLAFFLIVLTSVLTSVLTALFVMLVCVAVRWAAAAARAARAAMATLPRYCKIPTVATGATATVETAVVAPTPGEPAKSEELAKSEGDKESAKLEEPAKSGHPPPPPSRKEEEGASAAAAATLPDLDALIEQSKRDRQLNSVYGVSPKAASPSFVVDRSAHLKSSASGARPNP